MLQRLSVCPMYKGTYWLFGFEFGQTQPFPQSLSDKYFALIAKKQVIKRLSKDSKSFQVISFGMHYKLVNAHLLEVKELEIVFKNPVAQTIQIRLVLLIL